MFLELYISRKIPINCPLLLDAYLKVGLNFVDIYVSQLMFTLVTEFSDVNSFQYKTC